MNLNMNMRIAGSCYLLTAVYFLAVGLVFVFAAEFFPFHSDVIQTPWSELDMLSQTLYLGMMRTEGAGFLASSVAIAFFLFVPFRRGEEWSCWAMSAVGIAEHFPTFLANLHVSQITSASPPWQAAAAGMALVGIGLALGVSGSRKRKSPGLSY